MGRHQSKCTNDMKQSGFELQFIVSAGLSPSVLACPKVIMVLDLEDRYEMLSKDWLLLTVSCRPLSLVLLLFSLWTTNKISSSFFFQEGSCHLALSPVLCSSFKHVSQMSKCWSSSCLTFYLPYILLTWIYKQPETSPQAVKRSSLSAHDTHWSWKDHPKILSLSLWVLHRH